MKSDYGLILDFDCWLHPAFRPFTELMDGRKYDQEALNSAWAFFKAGWKARDEQGEGGTSRG